MRKPKPSVYSVGSRWEYVSPAGERGAVWLHKRDDLEIWMYEFCFRDGSGWQRDWAPSRRKAVELCSLCFRKCKPRFRRTAPVNVL